MRLPALRPTLHSTTTRPPSLTPFFLKSGSVTTTSPLHLRRTFFCPSHSPARISTPQLASRNASSRAGEAESERRRTEEAEREAKREAEREAEEDERASKSQAMGDRLKYLMKKYGWAAVGVYFLYGAIDFGLVFLAINVVGADQVRQAEDWFLEKVDWKQYTERWSEERRQKIPGVVDSIGTRIHEYSEKHHRETKETLSEAHNVELGKVKSGHNSMWTTAILAYTIHKTLLLPFRLGLTAGTLPQIVRQLQRWGWNVGRAVEKPKSAALLALSLRTPLDERPNN